MWLFQKRFWAKVKNDRGERIESLRFSVPALHVGVLEYGAGQLTTNNAALDGKTVRLYYPPEAVSDKDFLKSLETAPVVVGGHDSTTNEQNKRIDGWAHNVSYDIDKKAAMISGVVKGNKEVAYILGNLGNAGFGASAFVDIHYLKIENGVTPDGQTYNAIAGELRATHVALAPNVRDPENKIKVSNAVVINSHGEINKSEDIPVEAKEIALIVQNAIKEELSAKNASDEIKELKASVLALKNAVEEMKKEKEKEEKEPDGDEGKAENEETEEEKKKKEKEDKEPVTLENAKPSQALVAAFASAYNTDFGAKTPSFAVLAALAGIKEDEASVRIALVNAKFSELGSKTALNRAEMKTPIIWEQKSSSEVF